MTSRTGRQRSILINSHFSGTHDGETTWTTQLRLMHRLSLTHTLLGLS
jgi:hypothetical protein